MYKRLKLKFMYIFIMSSSESVRDVVINLGNTFNNQQNREKSYFDFYDDSLIIHGFPPNLPTNKDGFKQFICSLWDAFPNIIITFEDIIIEENKVAGRYNLAGTHNGKFMDLQPTNRQFKVNGMTVFTFRDSKCVERWNLVDMNSLMAQLTE
jgi:predicted ester cyclase